MSRAKSIGGFRGSTACPPIFERLLSAFGIRRPPACHELSVGRFLLFFFPSRTRSFGMPKRAFLGFFIGVALGCLFGVVMAVLPEGSGSKEQPGILSVNERTGKAQFHIKGRPEIK